MRSAENKDGELPITMSKVQLKNKKFLDFELSFCILIFSFLISLLPLAKANASTTDGTIDSTNKYAWGENIGWINFGDSGGNVHVTVSGLTGYAWGENIGWISLNCSNTSSCSTVDYGIINDVTGRLSGYAWGENVGWISFRPPHGGVDIEADGDFAGYAWGENTGWIVFNCSTTQSCDAVSYKVSTDYRPSGGGGGGGGGGDGDGETSLTPTPSVTPNASVTPTSTVTPTPSFSVSPTPTQLPPVSTATPTALPPGYFPPTGGLIIKKIIETTKQVAVKAPETIITVVANKKTVKTVSGIAVAATALATIPTVVGIFSTATGASNYFIYLILTFLELLGLRAKRKPWGTIYNSFTKQPAPFAKVQLFDSANRAVDMAVADQLGRYGFLVGQTASLNDQFRIQVTQPGLLFPSEVIRSDSDPILYPRVYRGGLFAIGGTGVINYDIPLDPEGATIKPPFKLKVGNAVVKVLDILFWCGVATVPINYLVYRGGVDLALMIVFGVLAVLRITGIVIRPFGLILDKLSGKSVPYALVVLNDKKGRREGFAVSDEDGRYFILAEKGDHMLQTHTPANIMPPQSTEKEIFSKSGYITEKVKL